MMSVRVGRLVWSPRSFILGVSINGIYIQHFTVCECCMPSYVWAVVLGTLHSPVQALLIPLAAECILGTVRLSNHWGISPNPVIQRRCLRLWC